MPAATANDEARLQRLASFLRAEPHNVKLVLDAAQVAMSLGKAALALPWVEGALAAAPHDKALLSIRGNLMLAAGKVREAEAFFAGLRARGETDAAITYNLSYAQMLQGKDSEGLAGLDSIPAAARPALPRLALLRAQLLYRTRKFDEALAEANSFLKSNPGDIEALSLRSLLHLDRGDNAAAGRDAQALLRLQANAWAGNYVLGTLALAIQDESAAESRFKAALEAAPEIGRIWSGFGFAAMLRIDLPAAEMRFRRAVALMPDHPGTWHGLGWTLILLNKLDDAREAIDRAMEVDRNFAENHGTLAVLDAMQDRVAEAELGVKRALRLDPLCGSAWYARSLVQRRNGDAKGADKLIERILAGQKLADGRPLMAVIGRRLALIQAARGPGKTH